MSSVSVTIAVAVDVGAAAVVCLYFFMVSVANQEVTDIQVTWVFREKRHIQKTLLKSFKKISFK